MKIQLHFENIPLRTNCIFFIYFSECEDSDLPRASESRVQGVCQWSEIGCKMDVQLHGGGFFGKRHHCEVIYHFYFIFGCCIMHFYQDSQCSPSLYLPLKLLFIFILLETLCLHYSQGSLIKSLKGHKMIKWMFFQPKCIMCVYSFFCNSPLFT